MAEIQTEIWPARHTGILIVVMGLSVFAHLTFLIMDHTYYANDTPSYLIPAENLLHKHAFVNELAQPELDRTPGYPVLLALFLLRPLRIEYVVLLQHALCVLLALSLAAFALQITKSNLLALASASVLCCDLVTIRTANQILTETIFTVFVGLVSWLLYRAASEMRGWVTRVAAAGLMGGWAVLIRPIALYYFVPASLYFLLARRRRAFPAMLLFTASFLLFPVVWATRNYEETGYFGVSTISAVNILAYRAAGTVAVHEPGEYLTNVANARAALLEEACEGMERTYGRDCRQLPAAIRAEYSAHMGIEIIRRNIPDYLRSAGIGLSYIVFGGGTEALSRIGKLDPHVATRIVLLITIPEAGFAGVGCWFWFRRDRALLSLLVLNISYFFLISAGGEAYSRFRIPVMPMYALLVGGGISATFELVRQVWRSCVSRTGSSAQVLRLS